jgi:hypothetical protein
MSRLVALATAGVVILALAGCGESAGSGDRAQGDGGVVSSQPTPSQSTPSPSSPSPTFTEDLPVPAPPAGRGRLMTIRGTIHRGVEAGCLILNTSQGAYLLVGPRTAGLTAGMTVEVKGAPDDTVATACQQGIPFIVTEVL